MKWGYVPMFFLSPFAMFISVEIGQKMRKFDNILEVLWTF